MDTERFAHNAVFVLVYDIGKNPGLLKEEHYIDGESVSKLRFIQILSVKAKKKPKMFGVMDLQGRLYKKVFLCKKEDFDAFVSNSNVGLIADVM